MHEGKGVGTGGQLVVDALSTHGVERAFCVPGESYLEVLDALYDVRDRIQLVTCRHEHGAAVMAEADGKLTGKPGICLVTRGPGACNASIGVHTAFQDSTPMILLVGQVDRQHLGFEGFQEVDFRAMFAPLAKWVEQIDRVDKIPSVMARAFYTATSGRPGPVVIALPEDMLREACDTLAAAPYSAVRPSPDPARLEALRTMLGRAERPLMIVGGSCWSDLARERIVQFAEANGLPTVAAFRRHDLFDNRHPLFVGALGLGGDPALVARIKQADLLVAAGTRLGEMMTQGYTLLDWPRPSQTLVHVHPSAEEFGRVYQPDLAIQAEPGAFAEAAAGLDPVDGSRWRDWAGSARRDYEASRVPPDYGSKLDMGRVMMELDAVLPDDAIATVDAGNFSGWPQRFLRFGGGRRLLGATNGAMGYGMPAAVAAAIQYPERMVVAFAGDGGFGMTGQELATARQFGVAPLALVINNGMYGSTRMHQERRHPGREIANDLINPDFAAMARAMGGHGETVRETAEFGPALQRARESGLPAVIELLMDPDQITTRTTITEIRDAARKAAAREPQTV